MSKGRIIHSRILNHYEDGEAIAQELRSFLFPRSEATIRIHERKIKADGETFTVNILIVREKTPR